MALAVSGGVFGQRGQRPGRHVRRFHEGAHRASVRPGLSARLAITGCSTMALLASVTLSACSGSTPPSAGASPSFSPGGTASPTSSISASSTATASASASASPTPTESVTPTPTPTPTPTRRPIRISHRRARFPPLPRPPAAAARPDSRIPCSSASARRRFWPGPGALPTAEGSSGTGDAGSPIWPAFIWPAAALRLPAGNFA